MSNVVKSISKATGQTRLLRRLGLTMRPSRVGTMAAGTLCVVTTLASRTIAYTPAPSPPAPVPTLLVLPATSPDAPRRGVVIRPQLGPTPPTPLGILNGTNARTVILRPTPDADFAIAPRTTRDRTAAANVWLFGIARPWRFVEVTAPVTASPSAAPPSPVSQPGDIHLTIIPRLPASLDGSQPPSSPASDALRILPLADVQAGLALLASTASLRPEQFTWPVMPDERWRVPPSDAVAPPADAWQTVWAEASAALVASTLARIAGADRPLAAEVARQLTLVGQARPDSLSDDADAPAWSLPLWADNESVSALVDAIMPASASASPAPSQQVIGAAAEAWLSATPRNPSGVSLHAWIIDDAPRRSHDAPATAQGMTIGLLNLTPRLIEPSMPGFEPASGALRSEPATLARVTLRPDSPASSRSSAAAPASAMLRWSTPPASSNIAHLRDDTHQQPLSALITGVALRPPGLTMAPAIEDWTLATLRRNTPLASTMARGSVLYDRELDRVRILLQVLAPSGWVEVTFDTSAAARRAAHNAAHTPKRLRIFADGRVQPFNPDGTPTPAGASPPAYSIAVDQGPTQFSVTIDLPAEQLEVRPAIDAPSISARWLRLGWTATDGRTGQRVAWPRPMLPWDLTPGRLLIDIDAWER